MCGAGQGEVIAGVDHRVRGHHGDHRDRHRRPATPGMRVSSSSLPIYPARRWPGVSPVPGLGRLVSSVSLIAFFVIAGLAGVASWAGASPASAAGASGGSLALQGTGGNAFLTVTVTDAGGASVGGAAISAIDGDVPPTVEDAITDMAGQTNLVSFRVGDVVTVTATSSGLSATGTVALPGNTSLTLVLTANPPPASTATMPPPVATATAVSAPSDTPTVPAGSDLTSLRLVTVDGTGLALPGAGYRVELPDGSSRWADDGDDGLTDGVTTVWSLPVGSLVTVVPTAVPAGHAAPLAAMAILSGNQGSNVLTLVAPATGLGTAPATAAATSQATSPPGEGSRVALAVLTCPNDLLGGQTHYASGVVAGPEACDVGTATFIFAGPAGTFAFATGEDGAAVATLPAGTYAVTLRLAGSGTDHGVPGSLTVDGFSEAILTAVAYVTTGAPTSTPTDGLPGTGSLALAVLDCPPARSEAAAEFSAGAPGEAITDRLATVPGCVARGARLVVIPFGDASLEPIAVTVDATGRAEVPNLPPTADRAPHRLVERETARTDAVGFEIEVGKATGVIVRFYAGGAGAGSPVPGDGTGGIPGGGSGHIGDGTGGFTSRPPSGPGDALPAAGTGSGGDGGSLASRSGGDLALIAGLLALALAAGMSAIRRWRRSEGVA